MALTMSTYNNSELKYTVCKCFRQLKSFSSYTHIHTHRHEFWKSCSSLFTSMRFIFHWSSRPNLSLQSESWPTRNSSRPTRNIQIRQHLGTIFKNYTDGHYLTVTQNVRVRIRKKIPLQEKDTLVLLQPRNAYDAMHKYTENFSSIIYSRSPHPHKKKTAEAEIKWKRVKFKKKDSNIFVILYPIISICVCVYLSTVQWFSNSFFSNVFDIF